MIFYISRLAYGEDLGEFHLWWLKDPKPFKDVPTITPEKICITANKSSPSKVLTFAVNSPL